MRPPLLDLLAAYHAGRTDFPLSELGPGPLRWALECGLAPVVARCCADDPDAPTSPQWDLVRGSELAARVVAADQAQAALELIDACLPRVGPLTLLKGIWLAHSLHAEPHLRPMRDVDVMVEPEAAREVERVLVELGYEPQSDDPEGDFAHNNHLVPYRHPATHVLVEVHHGLVPPRSHQASDPAFARDRIRAELRDDVFHGRPVRRLSDALLLCHVAAHWATSLDVVAERGGLVIMLDVPALVRRIGWASSFPLFSGASASAVLLVLSYLQARGLVTLEERVLPELRRRQRAFGRGNLAVLQRMIDRHLVGGRPFGAFLSTARNFGIVWLVLLTPRPPLVNVMALPWSLLPLSWRRAATPAARPFARLLGVEMQDLGAGR